MGKFEATFARLGVVGFRALRGGVAVGMLALASAISGSGAVGAAVSVTGSPEPPAFSVSNYPGAYPASTRNSATWQSWAAAQRRSMETTPWAHELLSSGFQLTSLSYVDVGEVSGTPIPAGVTTVAAVLTYVPLSLVSSQEARQLAPRTWLDPCSSITGGRACISGAPTTGGQVINATYTYTGSGVVRGHVELGSYGCPGTAVRNGYNVTLTYEQYQSVVYTTSRGISEWSSTFWKYNGGVNYTDWGSECATV